eukprot:1346960-Amorphochlora_amoeboformis.AAC.1
MKFEIYCQFEKGLHLAEERFPNFLENLPLLLESYSLLASERPKGSRELKANERQGSIDWQKMSKKLKVRGKYKLKAHYTALLTCGGDLAAISTLSVGRDSTTGVDFCVTYPYVTAHTCLK